MSRFQRKKLLKNTIDEDEKLCYLAYIFKCIEGKSFLHREIREPAAGVSRTQEKKASGSRAGSAKAKASSGSRSAPLPALDLFESERARMFRGESGWYRD